MPRIRPLLLTLPAILLLISGCSPQVEETQAEEVSISLAERMTIDGGAENEGGEPLLASVSRITAGPEGNIFLFDGGSHRILQYTAGGAFVNAFGRQGGGPAEFESVSCLYVDGDGRIITTDPGNARFSVFNRQGAMLLNQPQLRIRRVTDIRKMPDGRYLVAGWHQQSERLLHIMSSDLSRMVTSFGKLPDLTDSDDESVLQSWRNAAGYSVVLGEDRIAFAPGLYDGTVYFYRRESQGEWSLAERAEGYSTVESPIGVASSSPSEMTVMNHIPPDRMLSFSVGEGGVVTVKYETVESRGLWRTDSGALVHLYFHFGEEGANLVAEHFGGSNFALDRYGILPLDIESGLMPHWIDGNGDLYAAREDSALAKKLRLNGLFQP